NPRVGMPRGPINQPQNNTMNFSVNANSDNYNQINSINQSANVAGVSQGNYYTGLNQQPNMMPSSQMMAGSQMSNQIPANQQCSAAQYFQNMQGQSMFNGAPTNNPQPVDYNQMANQNNQMMVQRYLQQSGGNNQMTPHISAYANQPININQIPVGRIDNTGTPFQGSYEMAVNSQGQRFIISRSRDTMRNTFRQTPTRQMVNNPTPVQNFSSMSASSNNLMYITPAGDPAQRLFRISNTPNFQSNANYVVQVQNQNPGNSIQIQNPTPSQTTGLQQSQMVYFNNSSIPYNLVDINNKMQQLQANQPNPQMIQYPPNSYPQNNIGNFR
ncbi:hypothetical protein MXB_409, partial [Myxobolus squamalis]